MSIETQKGLVAFFDILGYSAFMENNKVEDAALKINDFINELENFDMNDFLQRFEIRDRIDDVLKEIGYVVISDSILITLECDKHNTDTYRLYSIVFSLYCALLSKKLFIFGLPLRGCVEYGEYYIKNNTFAGKPIIKAYKKNEKLNLSVCEISESIFSEDVSIDKFGNLFVPYLIPTKNGDKQSILLNFLIKLHDEDEYSLEALSDPKQFVVNSFSAHNKYIGSNVYQKIDNTEMFIRYCKALRFRRLEEEKFEG